MHIFFLFALEPPPAASFCSFPFFTEMLNVLVKAAEWWWPAATSAALWYFNLSMIFGV